MDVGNTERQITEEQIRRFAENLKRQEYGAGTIENYVRSIRAFSVWCQGLPDKAGVLAWKAHLIDCYAPASVNAMLAGINCFFKFQGWSDCAAKPLRLQRRSFSIPEWELSRDEYLRLIQTARASGNERLALVMETICATGIRVGEVGYITVEAARAGRTEIYLKGKIRTILIPRKLCGKLLRYARRQHTGSGKIFLTRRRNPLSRVQIWSEMKKLCAAAGVMESKVFPHNLRHLFVRTYDSLYKDIVKLADLLGHSSVNTTRIYLLTDGAEHIWQLERMNLLC